MKAYFLSDIHLKSVNERSGQLLLHFLKYLDLQEKEEFQLFLLGDIFDLWVSGHSYFQRRYGDLLKHLQNLKSRGVVIHYFEGNHDLHLQPYWQDRLGCQVYTGAEYFKIQNWNLRCEHGDEINRDDISYLRLRRFLRSPPLKAVAHAIPGRVWHQIGSLWSTQSRKKSSVYRNTREQSLVAMIHTHAEKVHREQEFDLIVTGHMHVWDYYEFERLGKRAISINLGSWFTEPCVLLMNEGQLLRLDLDIVGGELSLRESQLGFLGSP